MQALANVSVKRPVFATVLVLGIAVLGIAGYSQLGVDRFPKVDIPMVVGGHAPARRRARGGRDRDHRQDRGALNTISGIDELRSISSEGVSQVFITFELEKNIDVAAQEVRDKVNVVLPDLPRDIDPPIVSKLDPDATPVLYLAVRSTRADTSVRQLTELADKEIRRRLESVTGVGQVTVLGGRKRQVNVWLDPVKLRALGLTAADVQRAIAAQNLTLPGGSVKSGAEQLTLRIHGRVSNPAALGDLVVRERDGHPIRVADVGARRGRRGGRRLAGHQQRRARRACCRSASSPAPTPSRSSTR